MRCWCGELADDEWKGAGAGAASIRTQESVGVEDQRCVAPRVSVVLGVLTVVVGCDYSAGIAREHKPPGSRQMSGHLSGFKI